MPPPTVKTIRDLIYYRYAKIIAKQAAFEDNYGFIMSKFNDLRTGKVSWSNLTREYRHEAMRGHSCVFCGSAQSTHLDRIIPISKGGPDAGDNLVIICRGSNSSKEAVPEELLMEGQQYDTNKYLELLVSGAAAVLEPFGYKKDELASYLRRSFENPSIGLKECLVS